MPLLFRPCVTRSRSIRLKKQPPPRHTQRQSRACAARAAQSTSASASARWKPAAAASLPAQSDAAPASSRAGIRPRKSRPWSPVTTAPGGTRVSGCCVSQRDAAASSARAASASSVWRRHSPRAPAAASNQRPELLVAGQLTPRASICCTPLARVSPTIAPNRGTVSSPRPSRCKTLAVMRQGSRAARSPPGKARG